MGRKEDEAVLRDYDGLDVPLDGGFQDEPKRAVRWYHWLAYDIRARIVYATILAILLGVGTPLMIYYLALDRTEHVSYGSCLINDGYRFQCLINNVRPPTEDECIAAMCCYADDEEDVPFRCYHYFTPAYQYSVSRISRTPETGLVELNLLPKYGQLTALNVQLQWKSSTRLTLSLQDPAKALLTSKEDILEGGRMRRHEGDEVWGLMSDELDPLKPFNVTYSSEVGEYFFIRIGRNGAEETLFDTRLGPLSSDLDSLSFSTVIPTKWFYGLKGGQDGGGMIYDVVNGYGSQELPFYMAIETGGRAHGVLIETQAPFITQFVTAPGLHFHFQGPVIGVKLHFFVGPRPKDVYAQLHAHLEEMEGTRKVEMPPYWALGLHLCREALNDTAVYEEMLELAGDDDRIEIPYDSDCIDRDLRTPFDVDLERFPPIENTFQDILELLTNGSKRLLLTQNIGLFNTTYETVIDEGGSLIMHWKGAKPFEGILNDRPVLYPDFMQNGTEAWLKTKMEELDQIGFQTSGFVLIDNFPRTENLTASGCLNYTMGDGEVKTRLEERFWEEVDGAALVCAEALHGTKSHFQVHNVFGQAGLAKLGTAFASYDNSGERALLTSSSVWTQSSIHGGFSGLQVPFTWAGLMESVSHVLRNFMLLPFSGTPICGSYVSTQDEDTADELCLRWFQLGLLLIFARNSRGADGIRGPLDLGLKYQNYLADSIRTRYMYTPYYYTAYYLNTIEREPLIRPLIYDFHASAPTQNMAGIMTQFMIGPAIMAAPVLSPVTTRSVYFPPGQWYNAYGEQMASAGSQGTTLTISSVISETPVFIRGGHIIPTLNDPEGNAVQSRAGNYTIIATFPQTPTSSPSTGSLFVDDGVSANSLETDAFDYVTFSTTQSEFKLVTENCVEDDVPSISRTISEIRIFGFPMQEVLFVNSTDPDFPRPDFRPPEGDGATGVLSIFLDLHWCQNKNVTLTWIFEEPETIRN